MRKLKLSLDALQVDSFHATGPEARRGTVAGHAWTEYADESCFPSCNPGCDPTGTGGTGGTGGSGGTGGTGGTGGGTGYTVCGCETWETCPYATYCM